MAVSSASDVNFSVTETGITLNPLNPTITASFSALNATKQRDSSTTPAVTMAAVGTVTLSAGAATLDLRALTGLDGLTRDGNGLKVRELLFKNDSANDITATVGASNGIHLFAASAGKCWIPAGGRTYLDFGTGAGLAAVSATVKTIDFTGTGTQSVKYEMTLGA